MDYPRSISLRFERSSTFQSLNGNLENVRGSFKRVYDKMTTLENWIKTVLFVCVVALAIDPLFFFIPVIDSQRFCFTLDKKLGVAICVLRTFIDTFYVIHIIFHLLTGLIAPRYQISLRGEIVVHSDPVRERLPLFYLIVDIVSVLPIPQVVVLVLIQRKQQTGSLVTKEILKWVMFCQYIPRSIRIYPVFKEVTRDSGTVAETKWIGAALNLFIYLLSSHVFGAFWYLIAVETRDKCWRDVCANKPGCNLNNQYCSRRGGGDNALFLNTSCLLIEPDEITNSTVFNFGVYINALKSRVVESRDFPRKFFYCFWWGLRNLSALGQNLETSNSVGEIVFAIIICVSGLLLFAVLIGNVQKYLQSTTIRVDEMEEKKRDTEKWMSHRMLPEHVKERIRRYEDNKWRETRGIEEEAFLRSLPKDLRLETKHHLNKRDAEKWMSYRMLPEYLKDRIRTYEDYKWRETRGIEEEEALLRSLPKDLRLETKHHLYKNMLKRVPWVSIMGDGWLLEALCDRVNYVFYSANSFIVKEGAPVEEMLIVTRGKLESVTGFSEINGYYDSFYLGPGDICGDLLNWVLDPHLSSRLPTSNRTIVTLTDVEGFVLLPDDFKFVASYINSSDNKKFKHIFRFYSQQWRTWATCFIQAAWRKHCKRKLSKILHTDRDNTQIPQGTQLNNLGDVSRFVSKPLRNRKENAAGCSSSPHMLPQKPADPEFSKDE
ncbi:unnamed protein product [Arabis nemorensis]|uniref:Cyclic nucleotide-binding domain-containing protein n=1 Tax=Arabis nemorensis TaxID=586526 RepID=A0A565BPZ9_9BRAS|nr:unnamed protein product [Arabis nemorensis]